MLHKDDESQPVVNISKERKSQLKKQELQVPLERERPGSFNWTVTCSKNRREQGKQERASGCQGSGFQWDAVGCVCREGVCRAEIEGRSSFVSANIPHFPPKKANLAGENITSAPFGNGFTFGL